MQVEVSVTSHGETMGSNPTGEQGMSLFCVCVVCYQVQVSATGLSRIQRSSNERVACRV